MQLIVAQWVSLRALLLRNARERSPSFPRLRVVRDMRTIARSVVKPMSEAMISLVR